MKIIVGLVVIFVYSCIQATQYCTYSSRPSTVFFGFLGRYLIPLGPAFFLLFPNLRWFCRLHLISIFPVIIVSFLLVVIPTTLLTVANRYYGEQQDIWRMSFDLRAVYNSGVHVKITTSDDFFQTFVCPLDGLTGVSVSIVNPGLTPGKTITGYKFVLTDAVSGEVVREVVQPFALESQNYLDILFDPILDSKDKKYTFTIFPSDKAAKIPISIPLSVPRSYPEGETMVHGRKTERSVIFKLIFRSSARPGN